MKSFLIFILLYLSFGMWRISAHPSYGLIVLDDGTLIFCDILHHEGTIWKFKEGESLSMILTGQHSHFLYQAADGTIWGTDHDYIPARETNRNTLWKLGPDNEKIIVFEPNEDPTLFSGVNFTVDRQGWIYYPYGTRIYRRMPGEDPQPWLEHEFGRIMSLQMDAGDNLYVADTYESMGSIFRISPDGDLVKLADHLKEKKPENPPFPEPRFNLLFGINLDTAGNLYSAVSGSRRIWEITPDGTKTAVYHSESPWYPVAATRQNGILHVMEAGYEGGRGNFGPRIVRVENGRETVLVDVENPPPPHRGEIPPTRGQDLLPSWAKVLLIGILLPLMGFLVYKLSLFRDQRWKINKGGGF